MLTFKISGYGYEAVISEIGATLVSLRDGNGDLILPYDASQMRPAMQGAILSPWPNRIEDGAYTFEGNVYQLPINELSTHNAAHGLVSWLRFEVLEQLPSRLTMFGRIERQPGYPWLLELKVEFQISPSGMTQTITAKNLSGEPAPYGVGGHPYLIAGEPEQAIIDHWELEFPAVEVLSISADRLLPTHSVPVEGAWSFLPRKKIGTHVLNNAYSLPPEQGPERKLRLLGDGEFGVQMDFGLGCKWVQLYTADEFEKSVKRSAVAVEPMSCPPNSFVTGLDLVTLEENHQHVISWTISRIGR